MRKMAAKAGLLDDVSECSRRGVWTGTACVCDLGYRGSACQEKIILDGITNGVCFQYLFF